MLWDGSFESWLHYGIRTQPSLVLLAPDGEVIDSWSGLPLDEVLGRL